MDAFHLFQRRPSFPQGGLDWRFRQRAAQDRRPKKNSVGRDQIWNGPETDASALSLFPESIPQGKLPCECPLLHHALAADPVTNDSSRIPGEGSGLDEDTTDCRTQIQTTVPTNAHTRVHAHANAHTPQRKDSLCSCPGCPASIQSLCNPLSNNNNGRGHYVNGRGSCPNEWTTQWRSSKETVIINVGGQIFETYRSTLKRLKTPIFNCEDMFRLYFRKSHGDYFFDRDPTAFGSVLNFLRTGELHIPTNMCGPALQVLITFFTSSLAEVQALLKSEFRVFLPPIPKLLG